MRHPRLSLTFRWVATLLAFPLCAQSGGDEMRYAQLTAAEKSVVLADFRASRPASDLVLKVAITHKPRRGDNAPPVNGMLWVSWANGGPRVRFEAQDEQGRTTYAFIAQKNAAQSELWVSVAGQPAKAIPDTGLSAPIAPGLLLTPFDLHLPFTHWRDAKYVGTERVIGRPAHLYTALNPAGGEPKHVTFAIDRAYGALLQAISANAQGKALRTLQIDEFGKVDGQWMLAAVSVRDETNRDVDVMQITQAALYLRLAEETFDPGLLNRPVKPPTAAELKPL